ncbi:squalene/phytoene synthase family protein [Leucobacter rhizosphaerae]|uniref:Squalene/phytoene synthase family protein n=1 Tax=Leucobacter rhizosphaerae TaxID=2932245 RepID=A0ABY4FTC0_9MICO|nr:squalene/phytoene synthase family protein [Leucobacter rhizosphaerae]UOQ59414.1 squalene/phytoene synthase family protein [Leucobacter rhizosphaerae]
MIRGSVGDAGSPLARFTRTSELVAGQVIGAYSTSFGLATSLLGKRHRSHVRNIYALVRVADEIVDGVASEAGLSRAEQRAALERYAEDTHLAMRTGFSTDLVIHAFARTAREAGIDESLTGPFFDSMGTDVQETPDALAVHTEDSHASYVYGSAEVVGLMCLRVFMRDSEVTDADRARLEAGAKQLGAAFQNINFLRDLADDTDRLGRGYLGVDGRLTDADRDRWVRTVRAQLADARQVLPLLPVDARAAVRSALALFQDLTSRIDRLPAEELYRTRVRVPDAVKLQLASRAVVTTLREGRR